MSIAVIGLNYRTAPIELRESFTLSGCKLHCVLEDLRSFILSQNQLLQETVILSTCNRLEIYVSTPHTESSTPLIEQFLSKLGNIAPVELKPHLYCKVGDEAVRHLMRVACGLDSMILGETQILGQVAKAFEAAHTSKMTGPVLAHLYSQAIHAGKRARTETPISRHTTSVSHASATLVMDRLQQLASRRVLIVGAGEMAGLSAQALRRFDATEISFINRTYSHAETLANKFGGRALAWHQIGEALVWADALISATGAPHTVIYTRDIETALQERAGRPLLIVDIAVPRDVEATVSSLPDIQYYDLDDLQSVVDTHLELRMAAVPQVERIIQEEMAQFSQWYQSRQVTPVIKTLREWAQGIADDELALALNRLPDVDERTQQVVSHLAHRLVNRLLHEPTSRLRTQSGEGIGYARAVRDLFGLESCGISEYQYDEGHLQVTSAESDGASCVLAISEQSI